MYKESADDTKSRLLAAAGEVFSRKGYHSATVREICRKAKVNLAAVNYHFASKEKLYEAVFILAHEQAMRRYPPDMGLAPGSSPAERLHSFVLSFLLRLLGEGSDSWYGKLLARETFEPTGSLDKLVSEALMPLNLSLRAIIQELLPGRSNLDDLGLCVQTVIGQCQHYYRAKPIIQRIYPEIVYDRPGIERIARHIAEITINGLAGLSPAEKA